eukprot:scaffold87922_cov24-Phaeocystis_antarctica.AAC.2
MQLVRGNDRACGAAVGVRSLQIRCVTRAWASRNNCPRVLKCDLRSSLGPQAPSLGAGAGAD